MNQTEQIARLQRKVKKLQLERDFGWDGYGTAYATISTLRREIGEGKASSLLLERINEYEKVDDKAFSEFRVKQKEMNKRKKQVIE